MKKRKIITKLLPLVFLASSTQVISKNNDVSCKTSSKEEVFKLVEKKNTTDNNIIKSRYDIDGNIRNYYEKVDYSGKGTQINYELRDYEAAISGNTLYVPVYMGKYDETKVKNRSRWSSWGVGNNYDNDYITYRGESIKKYEVESRQEYTSKRRVKRKLKRNRYVTWFKGNKWWNYLITYFVIDDYGFRNAPNNFMVLSRYTILVDAGEIEETEYDYTWRTRVRSGWERNSSRTVYRYRTGDIYWNSKGRNENIRVPLNYALYSKNNSTIKKGIRLKSEYKISQHFRDKSDYGDQQDQNYKTTIFYIPTSEISDSIIDMILKSSVTSEIGDFAKDFIGESIEKGVGILFKELVEKYGEKSVLKFLGTLGGSVVKPLIIALDIVNTAGKVFGKLEFRKFISDLTKLDDYNLFAVTFEEFNPVQDFLNPFHYKPAVLMKRNFVNRKDTNSDDVNYVSLSLKQNQYLHNQGDIVFNQLGLNYYGIIDYMDSYDEYYKLINRSFETFNAFDWLSYFDI